MYISGTIRNPQKTPTEINKNGAIAKVRILVEQKILWGISRHLNGHRLVFWETITYE